MEGLPGFIAALVLKLPFEYFLWICLIPHTHRWAHVRNHTPHLVPFLVKAVQNMGIFLKPEEHRKHHSSATMFSYNHGLLSGISNPLMNKVMIYFDKRGMKKTGFPSSHLAQEDEDIEEVFQLDKEGLVDWI